MKPAQKILIGAALVAVFLGSGGLTYFLHFYRYKAELNTQLTQSESALNSYRDWLSGRPPAEERLRQMASEWTLGFNSEIVDSRFRSGLSRMAESSGLVPGKIVVTPKPAVTVVKNPTVESRTAVREFRSFMTREYMAAPDIYLKEAQLRGSGTIGAVTRLLAVAQAQPWIWSVKSFTLKPQNNEATMFDITLDVTTALLPDLAPAADASSGEAPTIDAPQIIDPAADGVAALASIVERNVFAPPPPPQPEVSTAGNTDTPADPNPGGEGVRPAPPPPPYGEWQLTGLSLSPTQGRLVWMMNTRTGSGVLLSPGDGVLDAVLVRADDGQAVFEIGKQQFVLALEQTLADRRRVE